MAKNGTKKSGKKMPPRKSRKTKTKKEVLAGIKTSLGKAADNSFDKEKDIFEGVHKTKIRVIGVGGGGGNIVSQIAPRVSRVDFVGVNADSQALKELGKHVKQFSFGQDVTRGLGFGMDAEASERAARAEKERLRKIVEGYDICFLIASLGGGTGSGAAPVLAETSHELKNLTFGIFTMPFSFDAQKRPQVAEAALENLKPFLNAYVVIRNDAIFEIIEKKTPFPKALAELNSRLADSLEGFMNVLGLPGLINVDFADVRSLLEGRGRLAYVHSVTAVGPAKAAESVRMLLSNPLYNYGIEGVDRMLFNVSGDKDLKMQEVAHISSAISEANPKAKIIFGVSCNAKLKDKIQVTLFAIGCGGGNKSGEESLAEEKQGISVKPKLTSPKKKPMKHKLFARVAPKKKNIPARTQAMKAESAIPPAGDREHESKSFVRRNGLEVKKAVDEEIRELEKKEKEWDIPAFLRKKA